MSLESVDYIDDLVITNPEADDSKSEGDDHIRNIKKAIKATFPNIDGAVTATVAELNVLVGITATVAELIVLVVITATVAELNVLDGITATVAELNHTGGVTSSIQDQLDAKLGSGGNAVSATKLVTARTIDITGDITATATDFDGSGNIEIPATVSSISSSVCGAAQAAIPYGGVGSMIIAFHPTGTYDYGDNIAGGNLYYNQANGNYGGLSCRTTNPATALDVAGHTNYGSFYSLGLSGTWQARATSSADTGYYALNLWIRIS